MSNDLSRRIAGTVVALAALAGTAGCARANPPASAPAAGVLAPAQVITDIAHWRHPTKAVFAKYKVTLTKVTIKDKYPTFWVKLPFDPQTQPDDAVLSDLCFDLLKANGNWSFAMIAEDDHFETHVSWDKKTRRFLME